MGKPKLFRMRSPCFGIQWLPSAQHAQGALLVSGGGGSAKSGVQNQILLAPFSREDNPAEHASAVLSTGADLCTGMLAHKRRADVFCGLAGTHCNVYSIKSEQKTEQSEENSCSIEMDLSFQADFAEDEDGVNSACFIGADQLVTGGQDGSVRLWQSSSPFPHTSSPELKHTFSKHKKPVMTVSVHPTRPWVASASRDGTCIVWDVEKKKDVLTLTLPTEVPGRSTICRSCAFTADGEHLFSLHTKIHSPSMLIRWRLVEHDGVLAAEATHTVAAADVPATVLQLSPDRQHLAVGMSDGGVAVFRQDDLNKVFATSAHSLPVTGLAFPPTETFTKESEQHPSALRTTLVSCSADYTIAIIDFGSSGANQALLWILLIFLVIAALATMHFLQSGDQPSLH